MYDRDPLTHQIIGAAIAVSTELRVGLLESVYAACLSYELEKRSMKVERQKAVPIMYDGHRFDIGFRLDLLVSDAVIVEVKAIATTLPVHEAQLLTYMRMSGIGKGLLLNFNAYPFPKGIKRMVL